MKKEVVKAGIFLGCIVIILFLSFASLYGQSSGIAPTTWLNSYSDYLRITPEQNEAILSIQDKFLSETTSTQNDLTSNYLVLQTMLNQPTVDDAAIIAKQNEIVAEQQKLQEIALKYGLKAKAVLTPEQISLLPPGCTMGFIFGRGYGMGVGIGRGYGRGMVGGFGRGIGRGYGIGMGGGFGRGIGRGFGRGMGRGFYRGIGRGYGRGMGRGFGRGMGRGFGRGMGRGFGRGW